MEKLKALHSLLAELMEDDSIKPKAKIQISFINFHLEKAIKEQSSDEQHEEI